VNAFDWKTAFPHVFDKGGFDAVIGNPPYVRQEMLGISKKYFQQHFKIYHSAADLYTFFIEQGVNLLRINGLFSYIVANKWMRANYGEPMRKWLIDQGIEEIIDFGDLPVFEQSTTYPCIIRIRKNSLSKQFKAIQVKTLTFTNLSDYVNKNQYEVNNYDLEDKGWSLLNKKKLFILNKIKSKGVDLEKYIGGKIYYGIKTGLNKAFVINEDIKDKLLSDDPKSANLIKPYLIGKDIKRYQPPESNRFLILIPKGWTREHSKNSHDAWNWFQLEYHAIANYLSQFAKDAEKRYDKGDYWWELRACRYYADFMKPKITWGNLAITPKFYLDLEGYYINAPSVIIISDSLYLLGILNSNICYYFISQIAAGRQGGFFEYKPVYVSQLPIPQINFSYPKDKANHDRIVALVDRMLALHKKTPRTPQEKEVLQREIEATDKQIDQLVYKLYGLTEEEIKIVEKGQ